MANPPRLALLSGGSGWHVQDLQRACGELGCQVDLLDFRQLHARVATADNAMSAPLTRYDVVLVRTMPAGSLEQIIFRMDALRCAEQAGVLVCNPPLALETCVDKYLTSARLAQAGLPTPAVVCCQTWQEAMLAFDELGGDIVLKPLFGSEGRGLVRLTDREVAWRTFHAVANTGAVLYIQQFIQHPGWDLRVFVLYGRVLAAMQRQHPQQWRTNIAQGGTAKVVTVTLAQEKLALAAAVAVGTLHAGVDLICDEHNNWHVLEVNGVPGWRALSACTGVDVARAIVEGVVQQCR